MPRLSRRFCRNGGVSESGTEYRNHNHCFEGDFRRLEALIAMNCGNWMPSSATATWGLPWSLAAWPRPIT